MLRKKLETKTNTIKENNSLRKENIQDQITSKHFSSPFWNRFYDIETSLNEELSVLIKNNNITHIYNPLVYAWDIHCAYLKKYLDGQKDVMFVGMNPGPNGMAQTGVPFGNIKTVRYLMKLDGSIDFPKEQHEKRPIQGLACTTEEPSGVRFWNLLNELSGSIDIFSKRCFVHNFCPLVFYDKMGRNITPSELKGEYKKQVRDTCIKYLDEEIRLVNPKILIAIGSYVEESFKILKKLPQYKNSNIEFLKLPHPSPRSLNNTNWPEKALDFFKTNNLLKYMTNEI